mgnify:CR=1 FL=1
MELWGTAGFYVQMLLTMTLGLYVGRHRWVQRADELMPQLTSRLRDWLDRPADPDAPMACMRTLHTLKGGARLAGAMRIGEMAHRLESLVQQLAAPGAHPAAADIEALAGQVLALATEI